MKVRELAQRVEPGLQPVPREPASRPRGLDDVGHRSVFARELEQLQQKAGVRMSAHAELRVSQRSIQMGPEVQVQMERAIDLLQEKGGRDALLLRPDAAFIVNVPSRTVVTALDHEELKARVFTNIDSAVFL